MTAIFPRSDLPLLGRWIAARVRMTLRTPRALGFTFAFPLVLVMLFSAINAGVEVTARAATTGPVRAVLRALDRRLRARRSPVTRRSSTGSRTAREQGLLKRVRGTPLPMAVYLGSWGAGAVLTGLAAIVLLFVVAIPAFGVDVYARMLPAALVTAVVGGACLAALGLALGSLAKNGEQAMPLSQLTFLPLSFISGHLVPARRRAEVGHDVGGHLPAQAHRRRVRRLLPQQHAGRRLRLGRPRGDGRLDGRRDGPGDPAPTPRGRGRVARARPRG